MSNTATVTVTVADINDKNPEFVELPYSFRVNEGVKNVVVGSVKVRSCYIILYLYVCGDMSEVIEWYIVNRVALYFTRITFKSVE